MASAEVGEALDVLEACADAADDLDDPERALAVRVQLGSVQRVVGQHESAEANLLRVIDEASTADTVDGAKFELANVYSETGRPAEAAAFQEELLVRASEDPQSTATIWSNYANSLRLLDRTEDALGALERAWELLPDDQKRRTGDTVPEQGARLKTMTAQLEQERGNGERALELLAEAEELYPDPKLGINGLHLLSMRAHVLLPLGRTEEALETIERADHLLRFLLQTGPSYATWESMLRQWSRLDVRAVRALVQAGDPASRRRALLRAEAAKGRVTAWLEYELDPQGAERALDPARQERALEWTEAWLAEKPGRRVVTFFASDDGLAVFDLAPDVDVAARWLGDFHYERFRLDRYEPWEELVAQAMASGDAELGERADASTRELLDEVGAWLERGAGSLAEGGDELVIVPHRLLRGLPLIHVGLGGVPLSERFASVVVAPTLAHLTCRREPAEAQPAAERRALADADGTLAFARCEALVTAGPEQSLLGPAATREAVLSAFREDGPVMLSMHGDFDEQQPFRSRIHAADAPVELVELAAGAGVAASAVVLGVCEAGRSRHSISDEPWGFPTLLLQEGVGAVVAPVWQVDDLASFLLITRLVATVDEDVPLDRALVAVARWLRELTAEEAASHLVRLVAAVREAGPEGRAAAGAVAEEVDEHRAWLAQLSASDRPFESPLDWAAFQVFGAAPA